MAQTHRAAIGVAVLMLGLTAAAARAQEPPASVPSTPAPLAGNGTPSDSDTANTNPAAPIAGANSFTEGQVEDRLRAAGFGNIASLAKDENGVWRGKADKNGRSVKVGVDYQGNIVAD